MRPIKLAAPLAAVALLTGACGLGRTARPGDPPSVPPGPGLTTVWKSDVATASSPYVLGNIIAAPVPGKKELVLIDGATGKVTGRVPGVRDTDVVTATTDARGRPRVIVGDATAAPVARESVYDPDGRRVWQARAGSEAQYDGGYVAQPRRTKSGAFQELVQTAAGKVVARVPFGRRVLANAGFRAVRPGLLVLWDTGGKLPITLIGVSRPGRARLHRLRPPFQDYGTDASTMSITTGRNSLYAAVPTYRNGTQIAAYHLPDTRPAWHRTVPANAGYPNADPYVGAYPDPNGGPDTVVASGGPHDSPKSWFLRPDTGAFTGPRNGRPGSVTGMAGGRAYLTVTGRDHIRSAQVLDLRTGTLRTIRATLAGVTTRGYLITDSGGITAYRWK